MVITFGLGSLKRRLRCYWIGSLLCRLNGRDYYGHGMGIGILSISIAVQQEDLEEIRWKEFEMRRATDEISNMIFLQYW